MNFTEVMAVLESLGTEQNRKVYRRHGGGAEIFGVSFANLGKLAKKLRRDHELARQLWESGNFDARNLAVMIAEAAKMDAATLDRWAYGIRSYSHAGLFARLVAAQSPASIQRIQAWMECGQDLVAQCGWDVLAMRAMNDAAPGDEYFEAWLGVIETRIHASLNRTKHAMNGALIAIALRSSALREKAVAAAKRIGKVEVDHGETDCKTPDAVAYIDKALAYRPGRRLARAPEDARAESILFRGELEDSHGVVRLAGLQLRGREAGMVRRIRIMLRLHAEA